MDSQHQDHSQIAPALLCKKCSEAFQGSLEVARVCIEPSPKKKIIQIPLSSATRLHKGVTGHRQPVPNSGMMIGMGCLVLIHW